MTNSKLIFISLSVVLLAACGTKVPLTEQAPVVERVAAPIAPPTPTPPPPPPRSPVLTRDVQPVVAAPVVAPKSGMVYFDFDSFVVKPEFQAELETQAKFLMANKSAKISLGGHTDDLGGREYNLALGQKRADAVKRALAILGVTEPQMEAVSFGKEKPASNGTNDEARAKNRRVEMTAP